MATTCLGLNVLIPANIIFFTDNVLHMGIFDDKCDNARYMWHGYVIYVQ